MADAEAEPEPEPEPAGEMTAEGVVALVTAMGADQWKNATDHCTDDGVFSPPGSPPMPMGALSGMMEPMRGAFPDWTSAVHGATKNEDGTWEVLTQQLMGAMKADLAAMGPFPPVALADAPEVMKTELKWPVEVGTYTIVDGKISVGAYGGDTRDVEGVEVSEEVAAIWNKKGDQSDCGFGAFYLMLGADLTPPEEPIVIPPQPIVLAGPANGGSVGQSSAFLKQANGDGLSLYDHLAEVLSKVLAERPEDALAQIEAISAQVKATRFTSGPHSATSGAAVTEAMVAAKAEAMKKALYTAVQGAINPETGVREVPETNAACAPGPLPVLEAAELLAHAGVGLGAAESYRVAVALKKLSEDPKEALTSCVFWGKILGTKGDYLVAEATASDRAATIAPLTDEEKFDQQVIDSEAPGFGANAKVYYVCASLSPDGNLWTKLPDVTPAMLAAAASVKRLFSGDLASPVKTFPASPGGTEAHYLRAQLGRISVATAIAPAGYYAAVEQEEVEVPEGEAAKDVEPVLTEKDEEGAPLPVGVEELEGLAAADAWVHVARPLNSQHRAFWYPIPKRPKEPKYDEEGELVEEEEEADEGPEPEEPTAPLGGIAEDAGFGEEGEEGFEAWRFRASMAGVGGGKSAVLLAKSVRFPGAVAVAALGGEHGVKYASVYIGDGAEFKGKKDWQGKLVAIPHQLPRAPSLMEEEDDAALVEMADATCAEEAEWAEAQEALEEGAEEAEEE